MGPPLESCLLHSSNSFVLSWVYLLFANVSLHSIDLVTMAEKDDKWLDHLHPTYTQQDGEIVERRFSASGRRISITDAVFGDIQEGGPNVSRTAKRCVKHQMAC